MTMRVVYATCLLLFVTDAASTQEPAANPKNEVLQRFVGVWDLKSTLKPAKWNPEGGETTGMESTVWALKNRIIMIRDVSAPDGRKGLYISTHDPKQDAYPFWCFDSNGLPGTQWLVKWNAEAEATTSRSTDSPPAWTSGGQHRFPDKDTILVNFWMRDENGALLLENSGRKDRLPAEREAAIVADWKKHEPAADLPAELKVLDRMVGEWNLVHIQKPAAWTPDGGRTTSKIERQWILDGRFVMETAIISDGRENMSLFGFDPQNKDYRSWWFSSDGNRNTSTGSWNEQSQTMSFVTDLDDGIKIRSSGRFADPNQEVWEFKATDAAGKVYLDMDITATRQTAARDKGAKPDDEKPRPNDQSRLQGTWGAVTYVQNGQGAGEAPLAPEDTVIRFAFQGSEFLLLASGNAGETPKGTYKLGTSGKAKTIDLIFKPESNGAKGQTMSGIYDIDGDTLKMTYAPDGVKRPSDFKSAAGSKHIAIIFKRIKE